MRTARLSTAVGTNRRLEVGQRMSALPGYLRHQLVPLFASPSAPSPEHSSVMSMVFVSSHFRKWGDCLAFRRKTRTGTAKTGLTFEKTVRPTVLQAARVTRRD